ARASRRPRWVPETDATLRRSPPHRCDERREIICMSGAKGPFSEPMIAVQLGGKFMLYAARNSPRPLHCRGPLFDLRRVARARRQDQDGLPRAGHDVFATLSRGTEEG